MGKMNAYVQYVQLLFYTTIKSSQHSNYEGTKDDTQKYTMLAGNQNLVKIL